MITGVTKSKKGKLSPLSSQLIPYLPMMTTDEISSRNELIKTKGMEDPRKSWDTAWKNLNVSRTINIGYLVLQYVTSSSSLMKTAAIISWFKKYQNKRPFELVSDDIKSRTSTNLSETKRIKLEQIARINIAPGLDEYKPMLSDFKSLINQ
jgi:hypothetical protein